MKDVFLCVDRHELGFQLSIECDGVGRRFCGPKYDGSSKKVIRHRLTDDDRHEVIESLSQNEPWSNDIHPVARAVADADRFLNEECVSRWKKDGAQKAREELQLLAKAIHCPDEKAAGVDEWQTFDTAPETGEEILCYRPDAGVFVALYRMPDEGDEPCWFATTGDDLTGDLPTHWMLMPSGPAPLREKDR